MTTKKPRANPLKADRPCTCKNAIWTGDGRHLGAPKGPACRVLSLQEVAVRGR